ncbi:MAG: hypothetical protein LBV52_05515, partial [Spirochaetaceae bacterium]|nr:hypothetical protein [Spirochaetaceae bacterium]
TLCIASLLICLHIACSAAEALVVSFCFSLGTLLALVILSAVRQRSLHEKIPNTFRGMPLLLISAGLLSLIFSSAAFILLLP